MIKITDERGFCCDECPIGKKSVERRLRWGNDPRDIQYDHCGCDKTDYEFFIGGYCGDAFRDIERRHRNNPRKTGRAYRRKMERKKNKRLREIVIDSFIPHVGWVKHDFVDGKYVPVGDHVQRSSRANKQRFIKNQTSRAIRRGAYVQTKGNGYHKYVDYWNIMY